MDKQLCVMIFFLFEVSQTIFGNVIQLDSVLSAQEGETVVLPCFINKKQVSVASWYKQITGEEPRLITTSLLQSASQYYNGLDRKRYEVLRGINSFNLTIIKTIQSDSATYFCATSFTNIISFGNGTRLIIKGSEIIKPNNVQFELVESEGNAPLQCSVGGGEHRLYWFNYGSGESPSGSFYVHTNTSDSCVESPESDCVSPTCVYNLPKKSSSPSDAGLYHCALATCGDALFGNVYKPNLDLGKVKRQNFLFLQIGLAGLLAISLTINIVLFCLRKNEKKSQHTQTIDEDDIDDASMNQIKEITYATVKPFTKHPRVKRQSDQEDTLYAGLACHQQS